MNALYVLLFDNFWNVTPILSPGKGWQCDIFPYLSNGMVNAVRGTPLERKVIQATNNDPWGCTGDVKDEIAKATFN